MCDLDYFMRDVETSWSGYILVEEYSIDQVGDEEKNYVLLRFGDTVDPDLEKH